MLRQLGDDVRIVSADVFFRGAEGGVNLLHHAAKHGLVPLVRAENALPVPLIDKNRMNVVRFLVPADGVHVGIQSLARLKAVVPQGQPFPLGQRLHDLRRFTRFQNIEGYRALHAIQVIV